MMPGGWLELTMLTAYAVGFVLTLVIMALIVRLLLGLIRFVRTLNDYWGMRAASQFEAGKKSEEPLERIR